MDGLGPTITGGARRTSCLLAIDDIFAQKCHEKNLVKMMRFAPPNLIKIDEKRYLY